MDLLGILIRALPAVNIIYVAAASYDRMAQPPDGFPCSDLSIDLTPSVASTLRILRHLYALAPRVGGP